MVPGIADTNRWSPTMHGPAALSRCPLVAFVPTKNVESAKRISRDTRKLRFVVPLIVCAACGSAPSAHSGEWTQAAPMNETRQYPGLARLPDGRILAVTGHPLKGQSLSSAEIYDPEQDVWTPTGSLNVPRNGVEPGGLTVLPGGKILIAGGGSELRSAHEAELFDPATESWALTGAMNEARSNHSTTLLPDGRVFVAGGIDWATNRVRASAEIYDPASETWSLTDPMAGPRTNHCAVLLDNGTVLVIGGAREPDISGDLSTAEIFDPKTGEFRPTAPMHETRRAFRAITLRDGRVIVVGGARGRSGGSANQLQGVEIFDSVTESWSQATPLLEGRWGSTATLLRDGKVLVTGGMYGRVGRENSAEIFDPATRIWTVAGSLKQARNGHRDITLDDGRVLIVGGFSGRDYLASCEIFAE